MKNGRTLVNLAHELDRQLATKRDMVVPSALMHCETDDIGSCKVIIEEGNSPAAYGVTNLARRRTGRKAEDSVCVF